MKTIPTVSIPSTSEFTQGQIVIRMEDNRRYMRGCSAWLKLPCKVGEIVEPITSKHQLASGCWRYDQAIVLSVEPFKLVSMAGDMLWSSTVECDNFKVVGEATPTMMAAVSHRI